MKYSELIAALIAAGCYIARHGANHDIWYSPITQKKFPKDNLYTLIEAFTLKLKSRIMKATVVIEKAKDGTFSCYMEDADRFDFALFGNGETAEEAKNDLLTAYGEIKEMNAEEGKETPKLGFEWKYDLQSFFDYFSVINVSKLADKAGINASQLRQYRSGLSKASQKQYDKLEECVHEIGKELITARF